VDKRRIRGGGGGIWLNVGGGGGSLFLRQWQQAQKKENIYVTRRNESMRAWVESKSYMEKNINEKKEDDFFTDGIHGTDGICGI